MKLMISVLMLNVEAFRLSLLAGLFFFAAALFHQHRLVSASDLSKVNQAFFTINGLASIVFMLGVLADTIFYSWGS